MSDNDLINVVPAFCFPHFYFSRGHFVPVNSQACSAWPTDLLVQRSLSSFHFAGEKNSDREVKHPIRPSVSSPRRLQHHPATNAAPQPNPLPIGWGEGETPARFP